MAQVTNTSGFRNHPSRPETDRLLPGLVLSVAIASLAFLLRQIPGVGVFSPLILSIIIGMLIHNIFGTPVIAKPGVAFSLRIILRAGIVLLGLQLTIQQVTQVGGLGLAVIITTLLATFIFTSWLGRMLGVDAKLTQLIAAGSSICGASAVIATNTITRARDEDVTYAVACVTVFGSLSMLLMPLAGGFLTMGPHAYGLWAGASIHEVAQVVAAAYARGQEAGEFGTIAKLTRVMMLAPMVMMLGAMAARQAHRNGSESGHTTPPIPWFVLGFVAMVALASSGWIPMETQSLTTPATNFLLATALAAMGLETDIRKLAAEGIRPAMLGAGAWVFISLLSLLLVQMFV
ncbi:YeiH family protein [Qingshengfaniella alkalisoli]|uniref:YeiH family putative sulfate export transporter n=1 Tax=Qingshengfaniella alkalisoli TaxID=2599296 RepID=A0A5B8J4H6_9RHOB|nr:YeiH family protein [Qingshengfaniella alkalisoli]QDY71608.1 YeiH family putative sulfate export transporter [Qingshengfaniella alkalisoli]